MTNIKRKIFASASEPYWYRPKSFRFSLNTDWDLQNIFIYFLHFWIQSYSYFMTIHIICGWKLYIYPRYATDSCVTNIKRKILASARTWTTDLLFSSQVLTIWATDAHIPVQIQILVLFKYGYYSLHTACLSINFYLNHIYGKQVYPALIVIIISS